MRGSARKHWALAPGEREKNRDCADRPGGEWAPAFAGAPNLWFGGFATFVGESATHCRIRHSGCCVHPGAAGPHHPAEFAVNTVSRLAQNAFVRIALMAVLLAAMVAFA
jgi:hypothetical protein